MVIHPLLERRLVAIYIHSWGRVTSGPTGALGVCDIARVATINASMIGAIGVQVNRVVRSPDQS